MLDLNNIITLQSHFLAIHNKITTKSIKISVPVSGNRKDLIIKVRNINTKKDVDTLVKYLINKNSALKMMMDNEEIKIELKVIQNYINIVMGAENEK